MSKIYTDIEHYRTPLKPSNRLQVLNIPLGLKVFITDEENGKIEDAQELEKGDIIEVLKDGKLSQMKQFYLFTIGTSENDYIELDLDSINNNIEWIRTTKNSTVTNFETRVEDSFLNQEKLLKQGLQDIKSDKTFSKPLTVNETFIFDTSDYNYARMSADFEFSVIINGVSQYFLDDDINLSSLNEITLKNTSDENIIINIWGA